MRKKTLRDIDVKAKRVMVRCDFNVPLDKRGQITDETRIEFSIPTIRYLMEKGARVILTSHLGRPKGAVVESMRLDPVAKSLSKHLKVNVPKLPDCIGPEVEAFVNKMKLADVVLLENTRFHPGEEKNDPEFSRGLARLADVFVMDGFGSAHRKHSSAYGAAEYIPGVAGFLMAAEIEKLGSLFERIEHPMTMIFGGAKISDKIGVIEKFVDRTDNFLIGGGLANTFLFAMGHEVGESLVERDKVEEARKILQSIQSQGKQILLPHDVIVSDTVDEQSETANIPLRFLHPELKILDTGWKTTEKFAEVIRQSRTIVWNGPMGVCEYEPFARGTRMIAEEMARSLAKTILGGGDTVDALQKFAISFDRYTHVSTGGGAMLEFLEFGSLPGVDILQDAD